MRTARALPIFCLVAGIALRSVGLGWGIPPPLAPEATPVRSSYHLDEESFLRGVARIDPAAGSYDVGDLHWGTLQFYLIWGALEAAQRSGFIAVPWRRAFLEWDASNFQRIYIAARAVSAAAGIVTLWIVFLIGKRLRDADTGLTAAAIVAVSPLHVVNSHFLTSDVTMTMLVLAALYFYLVSLEEAATPPIAAGGFFLGLAIAAKYNAAFLAPLWPIRDLLDRRHSWRQKVGGYAAAVAGFALGEPYAFIRPREVLQAVRAAHFATSEAGQAYLPRWPELLVEQARSLAIYGFYAVPAGAAVAGLVLWIARPSKARVALVGALSLLILSLPAARWPLVRYTLPLVPILALAAASPLIRLPAGRWRNVVCAAVLLPPLLFSVTQVGILVGEHPASQARRWIEEHVPPGSRIGQIWPQLPPLDRLKYDLHVLHPFPHDALGPHDLDRQFLVLDNLPIAPFSSAFTQSLGRYTPAGEFRAAPRLGPLTLPEPAAPHDWKYTHPELQLFQRK